MGGCVTTKQFIAMIGEAETGALKTEAERLSAIGDSGLAGGFYQQHWAWRVDNWPSWAWMVLRMLDAIGIENFCAQHRGLVGRALADEYNLGHLDVDPGYDKRCLAGLVRLGIAPAELDKVVSG